MDGISDSDGDGALDAEEYLADTDPFSFLNLLRIIPPTSASPLDPAAGGFFGCYLHVALPGAAIGSEEGPSTDSRGHYSKKALAFS